MALTRGISDGLEVSRGSAHRFLTLLFLGEGAEVQEEEGTCPRPPPPETRYLAPTVLFSLARVSTYIWVRQDREGA